MPDIDPAALSRPAISVSTPVLSSKTLGGAAGSQKIIKSSQIIPARIDLEPLYTRSLETPYASSEVLAPPPPPLNARLSTVTRRTIRDNQRSWVIPSFRTSTPMTLMLNRFSRRLSLRPDLEHVPPPNNPQDSLETSGMRCRSLREFLSPRH